MKDSLSSFLLYSILYAIRLHIFGVLPTPALYILSQPPSCALPSSWRLLRKTFSEESVPRSPVLSFCSFFFLIVHCRSLFRVCPFTPVSMYLFIEYGANNSFQAQMRHLFFYYEPVLRSLKTTPNRMT